jgi:hypothetical protein
MWNPFWLAFTTTSVTVLYLVAGIIGYTLNRHERFVDGTAWADSVIWWQVAGGLAFAPFAAFFWRKVLQSIQSA